LARQEAAAAPEPAVEAVSGGREGDVAAARSPAAPTADPLADERARYESLVRRPSASDGTSHLVRRLCLGVLVVVVLMNVPLIHGLPLARALPDSKALVVRDGLVLKGGGPEVYVLEDNQRRWISSLDAMEHLGYAWDQVHVVDEEFLRGFPLGRPIHVLQKCPGSPHIYRIEDGRKHWIRDIATLQSEGHTWEDVQIVTCAELRALPFGSPIPAGAGTPEPDESTGGSIEGA
jgi:hypothetical protein